MAAWSLERLLSGLHDEIQQRLDRARGSFGHPGTTGDATEHIWIDLLKIYLPKRYQITKAHIVDSNGDFSEQIDVVVYDQQYSPFILHRDGQIVVPAESVYAVFEAKQAINAANINYANKKIESVRKLHRTSLPIPSAGGPLPPKVLFPILGGILALESDWSPALGTSLTDALQAEGAQLELGCIASHGYFHIDEVTKKVHILEKGKPATAFLFKLIERLQAKATVPMIDVQAYAKWLG